MRVAADSVMLAGAVVAVLSGVGLLRLSTPFARIQAAGKASPVALLLTSVGAAVLLGWAGAAYLAISAAAMVLTLPISAHLLLRAVHRTSDIDHLAVDDLARDEAIPTGAGDDDLARDEATSTGTAGDDDEDEATEN